MQAKFKLFKSSYRRTFYAATLNNLPTIPARIVENKNKIDLETYEPFDRYEHIDNSFISHDAYQYNGSEKSCRYFDINSSRFYWNLHTWKGRLSISNGGLLRKTAHFNFSSQQYSAKENGQYYIVLHDQVYQQPDLLFAIPQTIWDEFLARLQHQHIVKLLNLSTHRHLYQCYDQIVAGKDDTLRINKAKFVSAYHFLSQSKVMLDSIAKGEDIKSVFDRHYPNMPLSFFRKFTHCPEPAAINMVSNLMKPRFTNQDKKGIDQKKRDDFIEALPCSRQSPLEFMNMLETAGKLDRTFSIATSDLIKSSIFYQQRNQFQKFIGLNFNIERYSDYVNAIACDLMISEVARRLLSQYGNEEHEEINEFFNKESSTTLKAIRLKLSQFLVEKNQMAKLHDLQERWHRNITAINGAKPVGQSIFHWHALFAPQTIGDVTFSCMTTSLELKNEGMEMKHCVGGYVGNCVKAAIHIIKVVSATGERSTLELAVKANNNGSNEVEVKQNATIKNREPSKEILIATQVLLEKIKANHIELNKQRGKIKSSGQPKMVCPVYPYDFADKQVQESIYQVYKDTKTLPTCLMADTYELLINKLEINGMIDEVVLGALEKRRQGIDCRLGDSHPTEAETHLKPVG